jgi:adenylosuccinate lyase
LEGLVVKDQAVARNLVRYGTFAATERLLMQLVKAGADRQEMHELIRQHSMAAWEAIQSGEMNPLVDMLTHDQMVLRHLSAEQVWALMDAGGYVGDAALRARALAKEIRQRLK